MRVSNITTCALGLAAALTLFASESAAQDTTRLRTGSDRRVLIGKGEVVPVKTDTVWVTRYDTVRVSNTVVRVDTVTVATPVFAPVKIRGPLFFGVFGGSSWPYGNIDRVYTNGFHFGGLVGYEMQNSPIGFRLDGAVSQFGKEQDLPTTQVGTGTSLMMHLAGDVKVNVLMLGGTSWYGIGGLNYNRYKRVALSSSNSKGPCDFSLRGECFTNPNNTAWSDKFGFNAGLGTDFHIGSQDMFIEARMMGIQANNSRSYMMPISLGVRFR